MNNNTKKSKSKATIDQNKLDKLWEIYDNQDTNIECLYLKDNNATDTCKAYKKYLLYVKKDIICVVILIAVLSIKIP